jgi:hypothetical protein
MPVQHLPSSPYERCRFSVSTPVPLLYPRTYHPLPRIRCISLPHSHPHHIDYIVVRLFRVGRNLHRHVNHPALSSPSLPSDPGWIQLRMLSNKTERSLLDVDSLELPTSLDHLPAQGVMYACALHYPSPFFVLPVACIRDSSREPFFNRSQPCVHNQHQ